jgi:rhodanese-related sulfurtransferase
MNASSPVSVTPRKWWAPFAADAFAVLVMFASATIAGLLLVHYRHANRRVHPEITLAEMQRHVAQAGVLILDARDHEVYASGHIPTAISLPVAEWRQRSRELSATLRRQRDHLVIVYCGNAWCGQAEKLQQGLVDLGHSRVGLFAGGLDEWRKAGLPIALRQ